MAAETGPISTIPQSELVSRPTSPENAVIPGSLQEFAASNPVDALSDHQPVPAESSVAQQDDERADYAIFHALMDGAPEQGSAVDTSFQWGNQNKPLSQAVQRNLLDRGAHFVDSHWGNSGDTATPPADLPQTWHSAVTAEYTQVSANAAPSTTESESLVVGDDNTHTRNLATGGNEQAGAQNPGAEPSPNFNWSNGGTPPETAPAPSLNRGGHSAQTELDFGRDDFDWDAARVQPTEESAPPSFTDDDTQGFEAVEESSDPDAHDSAPDEAAQHPEAARHRRQNRVGKFLRKMKLIVDAPPEDEYLPGYGPRSVDEDDDNDYLITVGATSNRRLFVDHEQVIDRGYVELPNGGLSQGAYNALQAKNRGLPLRGVAPTLRPDQREGAARNRIQDRIKAEFAEGQPAHYQLRNEAFRDVPVIAGESMTDYLNRVRSEINHRIAERVFEATVDAGIPLTEIVNRDGRFAQHNPEDPNDYRSTHEGGVRRALRRAAGLGATALSLSGTLNRGLNLFDAPRARGIIGDDTEDEL